MFESSKDLFWIVLSFVVLWVGIFLGWGMFYLAMMLRDARKMTASVKKKLEVVDEILTSVKKKFELTATYMPMVVEGIGKLVSHLKNRKEKKKKKADKIAPK